MIACLAADESIAYPLPTQEEYSRADEVELDRGGPEYFWRS